MKSIQKMIYDELNPIISISEISFIPGDKTVQVRTQGKLLSRNSVHSDLTKSETEALKIIKSWSAEIYGY